VTTREAATQAVLNLLVATNAFVTTGRRNRDPETIPAKETPALFVLNRSESIRRPSPSLPPIRTLHMQIVVYVDDGGDETVIPSQTIHGLLETIDAAFAPDDPTSQRCTLGGAVFSAIIEGETIEAPGDMSGRGLAIVPLDVILP
jgi:hypothetical protein